MIDDKAYLEDKDYLYGLSQVAPELIGSIFPRLSTPMIGYYLLEKRKDSEEIQLSFRLGKKEEFIKRIREDKVFFEQLVSF